MSFRKRNTVIRAPGPSALPRQSKDPAPGTRPSPVDGRPTTSTGTASLDQLLAGHAGLPLGSSLLIQEGGTTDFGGALLRYCGAEGLVQGQTVHVLGVDESWRRELPGLSSAAKARGPKPDSGQPDKMMIAWRYESLSSVPRGSKDAAAAPLQEHQPSNPFCHSFDLSRRLEPSAIRGQLICLPMRDTALEAPFSGFLTKVASALRDSSPSSIHRILVPGVLSPTLYGSTACQPRAILQFLHGLRALLRQFPARATALVALPISLFPRSTGLTRWMELLSDGVIELVPLQHRNQEDKDKAQGMLRVHSLPVFHEKGGGLEGGWVRQDMSFKLSASSGMVITPYSLPPVGDDGGSQASGMPSPAADTPGSQSLEF